MTRALAPTPNSQNEGLLNSTPATEEERESEFADEVNSAKSDVEEAAEIADQSEGELLLTAVRCERICLTVSTDKENRPRRKAWSGEQQEGKLPVQLIGRRKISKKLVERTVRHEPSGEILELTSLNFVEDEVTDFQKFCKGWEKEFEISKIGQGSFATVFKMESKSAPGYYSVWKLMPLKPSSGVGSRPRNCQTLIKDAATEVQMLYAMSDIDGFVQFRSAHVVKGTVPDQICKAHESWTETLSTEDPWYGTKMENDYPSPNQLWLLMEMTDAGQDLESMLNACRLEKKLLPVQETWDIFWGIVEALWRGEEQAQFEHRDLHPGNICVKVRDEPLRITNKDGIPRLSEREVTLIDYTQSRFTLESGDVLANAVDESIFWQVGDDPIAQRQYLVYRIMRDVVKKEKKPGVAISQMWKQYVPKTNVLWLHYMLKELMEVTRVKDGTSEENTMIRSLEGMMRPEVTRRWVYGSAGKMVSSYLSFLNGPGVAC